MWRHLAGKEKCLSEVASPLFLWTSFNEEVMAQPFGTEPGKKRGKVRPHPGGKGDQNVIAPSRLSCLACVKPITTRSLW